MANYSSQFSAFLRLRSEAEIRIALQLHGRLRAAAEEAMANPEGDSDVAGAHFEVERMGLDGAIGLWIYSEEDGSPSDVVAFALRLAAAVELDGTWFFSWANVCDRPRIDSFGGGAAVLDFDAREARVTSTDELIEVMLTSIEQAPDPGAQAAQSH